MTLSVLRDDKLKSEHLLFKELIHSASRRLDPGDTALIATIVMINHGPERDDRDPETDQPSDMTSNRSRQIFL